MKRDILRDIAGTTGHPGNGTTGHHPGVYIYDISPDVPLGPSVPSTGHLGCAVWALFNEVMDSHAGALASDEIAPGLLSDALKASYAAGRLAAAA